MLKELKVDEIREYAKKHEILSPIAELVEEGEKVVVKLKETAKEKRIIVYCYDARLYRYVIVLSIPL